MLKELAGEGFDIDGGLMEELILPRFIFFAITLKPSLVILKHFPENLFSGAPFAVKKQLQLLIKRMFF